jgi:hypothetical protein
VLLAEDLEEISATDRDELGGTDCRDGRRTRHAPNERHLSNVFTRSEVSEGLIAARNTHLSFEHDEELVALVPLSNDNLPTLELADLHRLHHAQELPLGQPCKKRHVGENVALECEPFGLCGVYRSFGPHFYDDRCDVVAAASRIG